MTDNGFFFHDDDNRKKDGYEATARGREEAMEAVK